jgi:hypothetical protein
LPYENAIYQWQEGERRLAAVPPARRAVTERAVDRVVGELRRRLGAPFTTDELVQLYEAGTDWCLQLAVEAAPGSPWAWDTRVVADAAFARYLREATDFAGGRRYARDSS